jgi:hypothetical protein
LLLLLREERLPLPLVLPLALLLLPEERLAPALSPCDLLLALAPLLAAGARPALPVADEGDLEVDGEEEVRDAIACSFGRYRITALLATVNQAEATPGLSACTARGRRIALPPAIQPMPMTASTPPPCAYRTR